MNEYQNGQKSTNTLPLIDESSVIEQRFEQQFNEQSDSDWNEASLARLLGYDNYYVSQANHNKVIEHDNQETGHAVIPEKNPEISHQNVVALSELFDDPQLGKTQPTFASNPFAKFGVVGLGFFVVFGVGATFLNTIISSKPKDAPKLVAQSSAQPQVELADNIKLKDVETGKLKAELALGSQAEQIKSAERSKTPKTSLAKPNYQTRNELNKRTLFPETRTQVHPVPVSYIPRQIAQREFYSPRVAKVSRPRPVINAVPATDTSIVSALPRITKSTDSMQQWEALSRLGSYGSSEIAINTVSASNTNERINNRPVNTVESGQTNSPIIIPHATPVITVSNISETADPLEPLYAEEAAITGGVPVRQLRVGTTAFGKLVTPLIWSKRSINNASIKSAVPTEGEKFIVQLLEPLTEENNSLSLPKNTQIVVYVKDINESGLVQLEATQIVIDGKEYVLPVGAITIRGNSGQPLIASKWNDKGGEIAARDAETFVVGSLAKVGKVINQPQEEQYSTATGFSGTTTFASTKRGSPNILGAVLEGGFEPLTEQILERNKQALSEIQKREEVWFVRAGVDVQIFINKSFQF